MCIRDRQKPQKPKPICPECGKMFSKISNMRTHRDSHAPPTKFQCDVCGKKIHRKDSLKSHLASIHSDEKQFYCSACERGYKLVQTWKEHQETKKHKENQKLADKEEAESGNTILPATPKKLKSMLVVSNLNIFLKL